MESRGISSYFHPCPFADYAFSAPGLYGNFLIVCTFTVHSHFSASRFLCFHYVRASSLKTSCVFNEGEDFEFLNCIRMVYSPFLCYCCAVLCVDIAIQCYIHSICQYNVFRLLCTLCSQLSQFVSPSFPAIWGNLGPIHVEISQFYCVFWHTSHPTALLD